MKIIVGCEFSQVVTKAFRDAGHEAFSCDLLPCEINPDWHIQDDIFNILASRKFDLGIFHPPCTRLCNSGVRWLAERELWADMEESCKFFNKLLNADINRICIENPIQHGYAKKLIEKPYDQIIQPWQHGHNEIKSTCLWLKNLPKLQPTNIVFGREARVHKEPPGPDRWKNRSRFYPGISKTMADQWG